MIDKYRTSWKEKSKRRRLLSLDRNENFDFNLRDKLKDFLADINVADICLYPDLAIAYNSLEKVIGVSSDNILFSHGSEQSIKLLLESLNGRTLGICTPTFQMVKVYGEIYGYNIIENNYRYIDNRFTVNTVSDVDVAYVSNPNNPTGTTITINDICKLCESNKFVVIDEAYYEYNHYNTCVDLINTYDNLYIVRTLSKACAAAGLRIGYIITSEKNMPKICTFKPAYELSGIAVKYVQFVCDNYSLIRQSVNNMSKYRSLLVDKYSGINCIGNYFLVVYTDEMYSELNDRADVKVLSIDGTKFIRITVTDAQI